MKDIQIKIDKISSVLKLSYPNLIFDVSCKDNVLHGFVLLKKQKIFLLEQLEKLGYDLCENITVLSDKKTKPKYGWGVSAKERLDIKIKPNIIWAKLSPRGKRLARVTQVQRHDLPFRVIHKEKAWRLLQLLDGTIGWVLESEIIGSKPGNKPIPTEFEEESFKLTATSYLGTPYLLGGTTRNGIDCSGLVQRVFLESINLLLPKHSRDQRNLGEETTLKKMITGNLVFAKSIEEGISHVGITINNRILHSCLRTKKVVMETQSFFQKFYEITTIKDIFQ